MTARSRYSTASAFRTALDQRLRTDAQSTGVPLNRLRKEACFNRLLARLHDAAPGKWALKGGLALIARVGPAVRGTKDVDANWRATYEELEQLLSNVEELDLDDWFGFELGDGRRLQGEGEHGALRYPVTARLDGRVFEQVSLDLNVVGPHDTRPIQLITFRRNAFEFVGEPFLTVPMVTPAQQVAEKLHAYTRMYAGEASSRARDLFDVLVIADQVQLPNGSDVVLAARETFQLRSTRWPPELPPPPQDWAGPWAGFVADYPLPWVNLQEAFIAFTHFWEPVLSGTADRRDATWRSHEWRWAAG